MFTIDASTKSRKATAHIRTSVSFPRRVDRNDECSAKVLVTVGTSLFGGPDRSGRSRSRCGLTSGNDGRDAGKVTGMAQRVGEPKGRAIA
jgi:hypothetical protein